MRNVRSFAIVAMLISVSGCEDQKAGPLVIRGMNVNGYVFDFENLPTSIQADSEDVRISTARDQIEVVDGTLKINGEPYGKVNAEDRISISGDKVTVNGEARKKAAQSDRAK